MRLCINVVDPKNWVEVRGEELLSGGIPIGTETIMKMDRSIIVEGTKKLCCLVDNGLLYALGVMYSYNELMDSHSITDIRPKRWFYIESELLKKTCPDYDKYITF